ncbi:MAG: preprotein translocase subunit YajC [Thermodesulfobacteriota bacterium]|nr:preprotein translocase subunit YajC [Thermodesulfobacteriota bacterium]
MIDIAYAMGSGGTGEGTAGIVTFIPLILMFVIFYFLLIRPQQKRAKEHREVLANLKRGDTVITTGGIHGKITGLTDTIVTLEIADKVRVKVSRNQISGLSNTNSKG